MNDGQLQTIEQVKQFLEWSEALEFRGLCVEEKYKWTETVLLRFSYLLIKRDEKATIGRHIHKVTGYSRAQISRLIRRCKRTGRLKKREYGRRGSACSSAAEFYLPAPPSSTGSLLPPPRS